ncbi:unnamed protein product [Rhizophagus irregularis]|uniref:Uncharacterized protein n=1 Tax=Rhizophagus irregularis TaxID=588596 RepID=A0A915YXP6_9GLOM|nr:unnamed protein product [Rhizophagus irregularis]
MIAKIQSYYMNNIQKELNYMSNDLTETVDNNHDTNREIGLDITPIQEQPLDLANLNYDPNNVEVCSGKICSIRYPI